VGRQHRTIAEGGWLYVATLAGQEGMLFASTHNVMRSGTEVTLWIRWEYRLPLSVPLKDVPFPVKDILTNQFINIFTLVV
jgi:hypothetical protein